MKNLAACVLIATIGIAITANASEDFSLLDGLPTEKLSHEEMEQIEGKYYSNFSHADFYNFMYGSTGAIGTTWQPTEFDRTYGLPGIDPNTYIGQQLMAIDKKVMGIFAGLNAVGVPTPCYCFQGTPFTSMYTPGYHGGRF